MGEQLSTQCRPDAGGDSGEFHVAGCIFHVCDRHTVTVNIWQLQRRVYPWSDEWRVPFLSHEHDLRWQWVSPDLRRHPWTKGPAEEAAESPVPPVIFPEAMKPGEWFVERQPPGDCDEDGWQYSGDFFMPTILWTPTLSWQPCRRRLWKCRLQMEAVAQLGASGGDHGCAGQHDPKEAGGDSNTSTQPGTPTQADVEACAASEAGAESECVVDDVESQIMDMMAQIVRVRTSVSKLTDLKPPRSGARPQTNAEKVMARIFKCDQILGEAVLKAERGDICGCKRVLFNAGRELRKIKSLYAAAVQNYS